MKKKIFISAALVLIAVLSIFVLSKYATRPESYKHTIESIDEKKATVMGVTTAAVAASTGLAAIPGDATTPIANQIMEISSYLLIVVCVLVLEKSLLTVTGFLSFAILVPCACALAIIYIISRKNLLKVLAIKIAVFAIAIALIIPASVKISDLIYEVNENTIEQVTLNEEASAEEEKKEEQSWLDSMIGKIKKGVSDVEDKAKQMLNNFVDAIAIFIITYCVIPILVIFLVIWLIKFLFGVTLPEKKNLHLPKKLKRQEVIEEQKEEEY